MKTERHAARINRDAQALFDKAADALDSADAKYLKNPTAENYAAFQAAQQDYHHAYGLLRKADTAYLRALAQSSKDTKP